MIRLKRTNCSHLDILIVLRRNRNKKITHTLFNLVTLSKRKGLGCNYLIIK